jgi:hypothetical protein
MARGFESKAVADQQESAQRAAPVRDEEQVPDPALLARRRRLEMSVVDIKRRLGLAHAEAHRQMLERALRALDDEIASLH